MAIETTVATYKERGAEVTAMHFHGSFPLDFLRPDERVRSADGGAEVIAANGHKKVLAMVPFGYFLMRWPDGSLSVADASTFREDFEEVRS